MMEHGNLSKTYRHSLNRYGINGRFMALFDVWLLLCGTRGAETVLRNGPRILRAMDTVRREVAAEHGIEVQS